MTRRSFTRGAWTLSVPEPTVTRRTRLAVAHDQRKPFVVALLLVPLEVRLDLDIQRMRQHPPRASTTQLVQHRAHLALLFVPLLDYPPHRRAFPRAGKRGPVGSSQLRKVRHFQFTPIHNIRSYLRSPRAEGRPRAALPTLS